MTVHGHARAGLELDAQLPRLNAARNYSVNAATFGERVLPPAHTGQIRASNPPAFQTAADRGLHVHIRRFRAANVHGDPTGLTGLGRHSLIGRFQQVVSTTSLSFDGQSLQTSAYADRIAPVQDRATAYAPHRVS